MGPEGGKGGGKILFTGTPEELAMSDIGFTSKFLEDEMYGRLG